MIFERPRGLGNFIRPDFDAFMEYLGTPMEERFAYIHGVKHCIAFHNGFSALRGLISAVALNKKEAVIPSLTYRRMADIVAWTGLVPHFCDVDGSTLGMSKKTAQKAITEETAVIVGVHPIVNLCDIEGLEELSEETGIPLVFDSVEAASATHKGRLIGQCGMGEMFSLHATKLINGFEGGYVTTDSDELAEKLRKDPNADLDYVHAAMALASLDVLEDNILHNRRLHDAYRETLPEGSLVEYSRTERRGHKNVLVKCRARDELLEILHSENILARPYYNPPLHKVERKFEAVQEDLSETEKITEEYLLLPSGEHTSVGDARIIGELLSGLL
jgi:dTDP-4-amino-4,6-dideoxygalactose transaminase